MGGKCGEQNMSGRKKKIERWCKYSYDVGPGDRWKKKKEELSCAIHHSNSQNWIEREQNTTQWITFVGKKRNLQNATSLFPCSKTGTPQYVSYFLCSRIRRHGNRVEEAQGRGRGEPLRFKSSSLFCFSPLLFLRITKNQNFVLVLV